MVHKNSGFKIILKKSLCKLYNPFNFAQNPVMKNLLRLLFLSIFFSSCDDGDLIVTDFDFENQELQWCGDLNSQVVFNINNDDVNEAIAFRFDLETADLQFFATEEGLIEIPLNATNQVVYRVFDAEVTADYFCNEIPPVSPDVTEEYRSTTGGAVIISTTLRTAEDHDGDGVPTSAEGFAEELDTDEDGIPNNLDIDDDGDNLLTRTEIEVTSETTADGLPDSDADGIPNYLDADDDNDGTITRFEDWNMNLNAADDQNDENLPHYLNPEIVDSFAVTGVRENVISRSFRYFFSVENLTLVNQGGESEQIRLQDYELGYYDSPTERVVITPATEEEEEEE